MALDYVDTTEGSVSEATGFKDGKECLDDILIALQMPVDSSLISQKKLKGNTIDYIAWFDYCDLLDQRVGVGKWQWSIVSMTTTNDRLFIVGQLAIYHDNGGSVIQMATGTEELNTSSYGDPSSNAEAMALRRACAKFGLARDLWRKDNTPDTSYSSNQSNYTSNNNSQKPKYQQDDNKDWLNIEGNDKVLDWIDDQYQKGVDGNEIVRNLRIKYKVNRAIAAAVANGTHREYTR